MSVLLNMKIRGKSTRAIKKSNKIFKFFSSSKEYGFIRKSVLPNIERIIPIKIYIIIVRKLNKYSINKSIRMWREKREEILSKDNICAENTITLDDLGLEIEQRKILEIKAQKSREVVIAKIDQDGFYLSNFGLIKSLPLTNNELFTERKKFCVYLVMLNGELCIKKDFKNNKVAFMNSLRALYTLKQVGCNVPNLLDVDFDNLIFYMSFILGDVLREELAKKGAVLRDCDVLDNPDYEKLNERESWYKRIYEGKQKLNEVIDSNFIKDLYNELSKIHVAHFIWNDVKYGNILIERKTNKPYMIDFEFTEYFPFLGEKAFSYLRQKEIEMFNLHFDLSSMELEYSKK